LASAVICSTGMRPFTAPMPYGKRVPLIL
jgi:hypothetical protein